MGEDWVEKTLGQILSLEYGKSLPEKSRDGLGRPVYGSNGIVGFNSAPSVNGPGIVVGRKGTAGSVTWVDEDFTAIDTTYWVKLVDPDVTMRYAFLLLEHVDLPSICAQTGVPGLNRDRAYEVKVSLPPLAVQRRIVDLMTHLDNHLENLKAEREAHVEARMSAVDALILSCVGEVTKLGDVLEIARGGSPRPIDDFLTDAPDGLNWIKIGDVPPDGRYITQTAQKIRREGLSKTRQVHAGDFLLSNSMSFGRPYITQIDGCIHDGWLVLSDHRQAFDQDFLYHLLRSRKVQDQFASLAAGSGVKNLNIKVVQSVVVSRPSLEDQRGVAECLSAFMDAGEALDREIASLQSLRGQILSERLDAHIDVPKAYDSLLPEVT